MIKKIVVDWIRPTNIGGRALPIRVCSGVLAVTLAILILIGMGNERSKPVMRQITLHIAGLPSGSGPTKVALVADIHFGNTGMTPERLAKIIGQMNASRPDIILLAGDFVAGHDAQGAAERAADLTRPLAHLRAPLGVVAVLGNHDYWTAPDAVRAALTRAGIPVLENQAIRRGPFAIVGIGDRFSGHDDVPSSLTAAHNIGGVPIVLTHSPDIVPDLPAGLPLVLAGHTHCGQVVLPWIGPLVMHAPKDHWRQLYNPRYRCGIVRDGARTTIVTAGVGSGTSPIRLGAMPDWWLITIKPWRTFSTILSPVSIQPKLWPSNWCPNHPCLQPAMDDAHLADAACTRLGRPIGGDGVRQQRPHSMDGHHREARILHDDLRLLVDVDGKSSCIPIPTAGRPISSATLALPHHSFRRRSSSSILATSFMSVQGYAPRLSSKMLVSCWF